MLVILVAVQNLKAPKGLEGLIGGETDDHGCLVAAGYSWDENREQCVRIWEIDAMVEAEDAVQLLLAHKYNKPEEEITVKVTRIDEGHVAGAISFTTDSSAEGGAFLAYKEENVWKLAYDGNGSIDCNEMRQTYGFSDLVLSPQFCDIETNDDASSNADSSIYYSNTDADEMIITFPTLNANVSSPLKITGQARGSWFFEATAPFVLVDWDGRIIAEGHITSQDDWMTDELVDFYGIVEFEIPEYKNNGALILRNANPSDLPEYDKAVEISIFFVE